ncbi:pentatricopeptide repeat-containing protein At1g15510, chloroplastic-like [Selaginella moellendorffii]|uniref:pentatricopeptide repeat-containing protein At1g15510, chloroplastic-like n=1 Tax=Selaginella moellendorffii TaxID=88036 RepID=UPI000D1C280D|nr:pentatricopeptide repeat-containing protein At1g15510, chloroplastic-like [Selaginella moellendorffii]|eukprot:XP_024522296.1 pentatricopeptide repeat-containing protein At1g15510, chloroplastic-like [Selaginella moellendorffii]
MGANAAAFASLLRGATDLSQCRWILEQLINSRYAGDIFLGNLALQMFGKLHGIGDARALFHRMAQTGRNLFSWSIMISALCRDGHHREALGCYHAMNLEGGIEADMVILSTVIGVCSALQNLCEGRKLHDRVAGCGLESDTVVHNALVSMYVKCGCLDDARAVFDTTPTREKDAVSWNVMMAAYSSRGTRCRELCHRHLGLLWIKRREAG